MLASKVSFAFRNRLLVRSVCSIITFASMAKQTSEREIDFQMWIKWQAADETGRHCFKCSHYAPMHAAWCFSHHSTAKWLQAVAPCFTKNDHMTQYSNWKDLLPSGYSVLSSNPNSTATFQFNHFTVRFPSKRRKTCAKVSWSSSLFLSLLPLQSNMRFFAYFSFFLSCFFFVSLRFHWHIQSASMCPVPVSCLDFLEWLNSMNLFLLKKLVNWCILSSLSLLDTVLVQRDGSQSCCLRHETHLAVIKSTFTQIIIL